MGRNPSISSVRKQARPGSSPFITPFKERSNSGTLLPREKAVPCCSAGGWSCPDASCFTGSARLLSCEEKSAGKKVPVDGVEHEQELLSPYEHSLHHITPVYQEAREAVATPGSVLLHWAHRSPVIAKL